jgi:hypothetical protein
MKYVILATLMLSTLSYAQTRNTNRPLPEKKGEIGKVDTKKGLMGDKGNIYKIPHGAGLYGGDAVVCRDQSNKILKARLLDYVENDIFFPNFTPKIDINSRYVTSGSNLSNLLEKTSIDTFISFRREYLKLLTKFETPNYSILQPGPVIFVRNLDLINIQDSSHGDLKTNVKNCNVEQVVIREKKFSGVTYYVQADIFSKLPKSHKRGLALHEAIYHSFNMYYGDTTSDRTRFFNRCISNVPHQNLTLSKADRCLKNAFVRF